MYDRVGFMETGLFGANITFSRAGGYRRADGGWLGPVIFQKCL
jgi:hypothetical protein